MKKITTFLTLLIICLAVHGQSPLKNLAFGSGERLTYNLFFNWKFIWFKVGTASLSTQNATYRGKNCLKSYLITQTSQKADHYFVMRDTLNAYYTSELVPLYYRKGAKEGKSYKIDEVWFSYPKGNSHVRQRHVKKDGTERIKEETHTLEVYDMLSMVQRARSFDAANYKKGQRIHFLMTDGGKVEKHTLIYRGKKNFKMDKTSTTYRCLVFSFVDNENGKEKEIITFYVTDDLNHLPVRLDLNLKFGTAKAFLSSATGVRNPQTAKIKG